MKLIAASSELLTNYKQAEVLDQRQKFKAVQTADGSTLFFGIGTNNKFYVIQETSGEGTGWVKTELSERLNGTAKLFSVAQNHEDGNIDIALVMNEAKDKDVLYTRFDLSNSNLDWMRNESLWNIMRDDRSLGGGSLNIISTFLSDTKTAENCLIVDVRNARGQLDRFMINTTGDKKWSPHPLPGNLTADALISDYMGKPENEEVIGLYTLGAVNQLVQIFFQPLYDQFGEPGDSAPATQFDVDGFGFTPENVAFAGCPAAQNPAATDIFLAGGGKLFYLAAKQQSSNQARPVLIHQNSLFTNVKELHANSSTGKMVVWGLNHEDKVFYAACDAAKVTEEDAWSTPLPLFSEVAAMSTYLDLNTNAITLFANHGSGKLFKGTQDPKHGTWKFENIELPAPNEEAKQGLSYTTTVKVMDANKKSVPFAKITLKAQRYTTVYINNVYYRLGSEPVTVPADFGGALHIIEWVEGLTGTTINGYVEEENNSFRIEPSTIPIEKLKNYDTSEKLSQATIRYRDGSTRPLLADSVSEENKQTLAASIGQLTLAYHGLSGSAPASVAKASGSEFESLGDLVPRYVTVAVGDALRFVSETGGTVIKLVKDTAEDVWHFVLTVGEKVYGFILDTIEKVASALESIWKSIIGALEDLIDFLKFLFDFEDMLLTKDVIKQLFKLNIHRIGEAIQDIKHEFDEKIDSSKEVIQQWANSGADNWPLPSKYTEAIGTFLSDIKNNEVAQKAMNSAPAHMLMSHFQSSAKACTIRLPEPDNGDGEPTWEKLMKINDFLETEKQVLFNLIHHITDLFKAADNPRDPAFKELLMKIVGDVAVGSMEMLKLMLDKVLDFVTLLIYEIPKALDAPMEIPLVSTILKKEFNLTAPSILDFMIIIFAVPATLVYKLTNDRAPFRKGPDTTAQQILDAQSYKELKTVIDTKGLDDEIHATMFEIGYLIAGQATYLNGFLKILDEETQGGSGTVLDMPQTITSKLATASTFMARTFVTPVSVKNDIVSTYKTVVTDLDILSSLGLFAAGPVVKKFNKSGGDAAIKSAAKTLKYVKEGVGSVFALALLAPAVFLIYEVVSEPETERTTLGLMEANQATLSKVSTVVGFASLLDTEYLTKQVGVAVQGVLVAVAGGLQMELALVHRLLRLEAQK